MQRRGLQTAVWVLLAAGCVVLAEESKEASKNQPPSLVELAERNRQLRKASESEVVTITNASLTRLGSGKVSQIQLPPPPADKESANPILEDAAEEPVVEEIVDWEGRFTDARQALVIAVNQISVLHLRLQTLQASLASVSPGPQRDSVRSAQRKTADDLKEARETEAKCREVIAELEYEAARAGVSRGEIKRLIGRLPGDNSSGTAVSSLPPR